MSHQKGDPLRWVQSILHPGDVFIDGGANVGIISEAAAKIVSETGRVIAVEPDPRCHQALTALSHTYPQVTFVASALAANQRDVILVHGQKPEQSSLYPACVEDAPHTSWVPSLRLDDLYALHGRPVTAVKLDIQGGELDAIRGADRLLSDCPHWCVEVWPFALKQSKYDATFVIYRFQWQGFTPHWMDDGYPEATWADLIAYCRGDRGRNEHINVVFTK